MSKRLFSQRASEDKDDNTKQAAIPLSKSKPDLVNGIPLSGEDYLLVVRQQAKKCQKTVVAPLPKTIRKVQLPAHFQFFSSTADTNSTKDHASEKWRKGYIDSFKSYQKHMQKSKNTNGFHKDITSIDEAYSLLYPVESVDQKASIVPKLTQHTILRLLKYHVEWLNTKENTKDQFACIFQLLIYLDPVLTSKNISVLRDLSRECIKLRSTKLASHIAPLNIIIAVISDAFGQSDLI